MLSRLREYYKRHERWMPIAFFAVGFAFDAIMLQRVDELATIIQQLVYLVLTGLLIAVELVEVLRPLSCPAFFIRLWKYREAFLHFMMGTLLNAYTIFFFKSASALTPYIFVGILIAVLVLNEFKHFGKSRAQVHMAF